MTATNDNWEYKTLIHSGSFMTGKVDAAQLETALNEAGREGWEVASTAMENLKLLVILKRKR